MAQARPRTNAFVRPTSAIFEHRLKEAAKLPNNVGITKKQ
jgi:hypothetical protein